LIAATATRLRQNIQKVIVGKDEAIDLALIALLCEGHLLLEDVPGTAKTTLAKSLARSLGCTFQRIQFTPDLLPSDVTGIYFYNQKEQEFRFRSGPVFSQILLADEINRATPRTQSSLLEAMQERQVTVDIATHLLRFEREDPLETLQAVVEPQQILEMQQAIREIRVEESVRHYVVNVCRTTRNHPDIELGASPRATMGLYRATQALAAVRGREFVIPDDVKEMAPPVLTHRLIVNPQTRLRGRRPEDVIREVVDTVAVPVESPT
jgi:MoxR-like ATPase